MTKEEMLKNVILSKYRSVREFTQQIGMPYSTISTIFKRGIDNSNVQNIIKICKALGISTDDLAVGKITYTNKEETPKTIKVEDMVQEFNQKVMNAENLTIDGAPASPEDVLLITSTLDTAVEVRKKHLQTYKDKLQ